MKNSFKILKITLIININFNFNKKIWLQNYIIKIFNKFYIKIMGDLNLSNILEEDGNKEFLI